MTILLLLAAALTAPLLWSAVRSPATARLAVRNVSRRRGEAVLVTGGAMLGTAIIVASMVTGDVIDGSIRSAADNFLGPIDIQVSADGSAPADVSAWRDDAVALDHPEIDGALAAAGIANLNLVCLSSVIPPGSTVRGGSGTDALAAFPEVAWGDRLYCVLADARTDEPEQEAWAGIGWWQDAADGRGVFVEHHGNDEAEVTADVVATLRECVERRGRSLDEGTWQTAINGARCIDRPICALVVATYATRSWC